MSLKSLVKLILFVAIVALATSKSSYKVTNTYRNLTTVVLTLGYTGTDNYYGNPKSPIVRNLSFIFHTLAFNDFYFKIVDANNKRF